MNAKKKKLPVLRPPPQQAPFDPSTVAKAREVVASVLLSKRWDDQGGYIGLNGGKWNRLGEPLGTVTPEELNALFAFAGLTPDEIESLGDCADCKHSVDGHERGYRNPCVSCLRPRHDLFEPK